MKKLFFVLLYASVLFSCENKEAPLAIISNPLIEENSKDICLMPFLGFSSLWHEQNGVQFDYYCDIVNPPLKKVIDDVPLLGSDFLGKRIPLENKLAPNTKYYWRCVVKKEGFEEAYSDIFSFTTTALSGLRDDILLYHSYYISYVDYLKLESSGISKKDLELSEIEKVGDVAIFNYVKDTVKDVQYYGDPLKQIFPTQGKFKFSTDSVCIIENVYEFINYGKERGEGNSLNFLALRRKRDNLILVYSCNDF